MNEQAPPISYFPALNIISIYQHEMIGWIDLPDSSPSTLSTPCSSKCTIQHPTYPFQSFHGYQCILLGPSRTSKYVFGLNRPSDLIPIMAVSHIHALVHPRLDDEKFQTECTSSFIPVTSFVAGGGGNDEQATPKASTLLM